MPAVSSTGQEASSSELEKAGGVAAHPRSGTTALTKVRRRPWLQYGGLWKQIVSAMRVSPGLLYSLARRADWVRAWAGGLRPGRCSPQPGCQAE